MCFSTTFAFRGQWGGSSLGVFGGYGGLGNDKLRFDCACAMGSWVSTNKPHHSITETFRIKVSRINVPSQTTLLLECKGGTMQRYFIIEPLGESPNIFLNFVFGDMGVVSTPCGV